VVLRCRLVRAPRAGAGAHRQPGGPAASRPSKLLTPAALTAKAPALFKAKFDTSKGLFVIEVHRDWAPLGADRFYNMVTNGFFSGVRFFRVIPNFMAQFGINGNPAVTAAWSKVDLKDDPPTKQSNQRAFVTYGTTGRPDSAARRSSSTTRTTRSSTPRDSSPSARSSKAWTSWTC
jgi:hypothetical protein